MSKTEHVLIELSCGVVGTLTGGAAGAGLGTLVMPGMGTAIGYLIGVSVGERSSRMLICYSRK